MRDRGRARHRAQQLVSLLRGDLDWITMKALERDRERRYGYALGAGRRPASLSERRAVTARPASAAYQLRKFIRRHRIAPADHWNGYRPRDRCVGCGIDRRSAKASGGISGDTGATGPGAAAYPGRRAAPQGLGCCRRAGHHSRSAHESRIRTGRTPAAISVFQDIRAADVQGGVLSGHRGTVQSAAYSPDGTRIVTASGDKTARIWDANTGTELGVLYGHGDHVNSAAYSPDGTRIVTASDDKTARLWDARTGAPLAILSGHGDQVIAASFSVDGARIVTASGDKTARLWDARTGAQLIVLSGHGSFVNSASFSPDGTHIVTASADKTARIWDARTGAQLAVLFGYTPPGLFRRVFARWNPHRHGRLRQDGAHLGCAHRHGARRAVRP